MTMCGYLILNHAASMPPYDPPNATTGLLSAPGRVALTCSTVCAKSAKACSEDKYPRWSRSYNFRRKYKDYKIISSS